MTKKVMEKVNEKIAKKFSMHYVSGVDLRMKRDEKFEIAHKYHKLVLLINEKGSICHAVHPNGTFIVMKSPKHLHSCFHIEFAANHFINTMREVINQ